MLFSTPILRYPVTTAPLTTLTTMSGDMVSPMIPNTTTKGTIGAIPDVLLLPQRQVRLRAGHGAGGQCRRRSPWIWAQRRRAAPAGEPVQQLRGRGRSRRAQGRDLAGHHPAVGRLVDGIGVAHDGQPRRAGHPGDGELGAERHLDAQVGGEHELTGPHRPAAPLQDQVVERAAGTGPARQRHRRQGANLPANLGVDRRRGIGPGHRGDLRELRRPGQLTGVAAAGLTVATTSAPC